MQQSLSHAFKYGNHYSASMGVFHPRRKQTLGPTLPQLTRPETGSSARSPHYECAPFMHSRYLMSPTPLISVDRPLRAADADGLALLL